jgi:diacylglycerol kinase (ATP)
MGADIAFIVNPASANGRTRRRWRDQEPAFRAALGASFEVHMTDHPGHAAELTRAALAGGASTIVSVGGDGTLNEVVNGFLDEGGRPWSRNSCLAVLPLGTSSDFVKTFGGPATLAELALLLRDPSIRTIDAGFCEFMDEDGRKKRYFLNVAEFGSGGAIVDRVNRTTKIFGGLISFLIAILRTLPRYRNTRVMFVADNGPRREAIVNDFVVANGRYFGAGLLPAPNADLEDGLFDVVIFGDIDFRRARRNLPKLRRGEHLALKEVSTFRCGSLTIESENEMIDLDGEFVGRHPVRFEILPKAVPILARP